MLRECYGIATGVLRDHFWSVTGVLRATAMVQECYGESYGSVTELCWECYGTAAEWYGTVFGLLRIVLREYYGNAISATAVLREITGVLRGMLRECYGTAIRDCYGHEAKFVTTRLRDGTATGKCYGTTTGFL